MWFKNKKIGYIEMHFDGVPGYYCTLYTSDGGITWKEIKRTLPGNKNYEEKKKSYKKRPEYYNAKDGSQWKIKTSDFKLGDPKKEKKIRIYCRLHKNAKWFVMSIIPKFYKYSKGKVILP